MHRLDLAVWSCELDDEEFVAALAALGVIAASRGVTEPALPSDPLVRWDEAPTAALFSSSLSTRFVALDAATGGLLDWRAPPRRMGRIGDLSRWPPARVLVTAWRDYLGQMATRRLLGQAGGPRLAVHADGRPSGRTLSFAQALTSPGAAVASVFVADMFAADGRTEWRWPFTVAALVDDPLASELAVAQARLPAGQPYRFATVQRADAQVDVLVIGAPVGQALARLLTSSMRLRCCLVIVCGFGQDSPAEAEPLLRSLVSRVRAEGVALVEAVSGVTEFVGCLGEFAAGLAVNQPMDVALYAAFRGKVLPLVNRDLLALGSHELSLDVLSHRLRRLPPETMLGMTERSAQRLGLASADFTPRARGGGLAGGRLETLPGVAVRSLAEAIVADRSPRGHAEAALDATTLADIGAELRTAEAQLPSARYVQQRSFRRVGDRFVAERRGYVVGEPVLLRVLIGPRKAGVSAAPAAFPEDKLEGDRATHRLQLVLHEPQQFAAPLLEEVLLPRHGDSSEAKFVFTPCTRGDFAARLTVLHRGRVLQTVVLSTRVVEGPESLAGLRGGILLEEEGRVRQDWSDLGTRRRFDMALVFNHTAAEQPRLTGVAGQRAWATDLSSIEEPVRGINDLISTVASKVADHEEGLDQGDNPELLIQLARIGADVYSKLYLDQLQQLTAGGLDVGSDAVTHIQVVSTRSDALVPIEFFYDLPPPDADAQVCPQHLQALREGRCPGNCAGAGAPARHVCPMGFWGLKKVIERHFYSAVLGKPDGAELVIQAEPTAQRSRLDVRTGALLGHSREVSGEEVHALVETMKAALGGVVGVAEDWEEWKQRVAGGPGLLLAFPHNEGRKQDVRLEIGGSFLSTLRLPAEYVRAPGAPAPLVFLLGCDTSSTAEDYASHVRYFRQAGAAAVVSTIATVFGRHAVIVGEKIVARLLAAGSEQRLGEIIRDAKREAMRESVPMALCVVAFGDADWRL